MKTEDGLDYEIVQSKHGDWQVWTPDQNGAVIGAGTTRDAAIRDAVAGMANTIAKLAELLT